MSWFLTIRANSTYSQVVNTELVTNWLLHHSGIIQTSPLTFTVEQNNRTATILLVKCNSFGNYALFSYDYIPAINCIELEIPYNIDAFPFECLASQLAAYLGWSALDDSENRQIWPPQ